MSFDRKVQNSMSGWKACKGAAICTHSYIATDPHQMSIVVGDHISVLESCVAWYRGDRNR